MVHHLAVVSLNVTVATFEEVLVLITGFTLPHLDVEGTSDVLDALTDLDIGEVTDEFAHGSPFTDAVHQSIDEVAGLQHSVDIDKERLASNKDLGVHITSSDSRGVGIDHVGADRFIATFDIHGGIGSFVGPVEFETRGKFFRKLGGSTVGPANDVGGCPQPILGKSREIACLLARMEFHLIHFTHGRFDFKIEESRCVGLEIVDVDGGEILTIGEEVIIDWESSA